MKDMSASSMNKISVIGSPGAGKSTFSKSLSKVINVRIYHLDRIFWKPGWIQITREQLMEKVKDVFKNDQWIIDGNYQNTLDIRIEESDVIFFLDYSLITCLIGICKRRFEFKNKKRDDLTEGCDEKLDLAFFWYVVMFRIRQRSMIYRKLSEYKGGEKLVIFKNRRQAKRYLDNLRRLVIQE
jgi:adenylate kinase family enzyme